MKRPPGVPYGLPRRSAAFTILPVGNPTFPPVVWSLFLVYNICGEVARKFFLDMPKKRVKILVNIVNILQEERRIDYHGRFF